MDSRGTETRDCLVVANPAGGQEGNRNSGLPSCYKSCLWTAGEQKLGIAWLLQILLVVRRGTETRDCLVVTNPAGGQEGNRNSGLPSCYKSCWWSGGEQKLGIA